MDISKIILSTVYSIVADNEAHLFPQQNVLAAKSSMDGEKSRILDILGHPTPFHDSPQSSCSNSNPPGYDTD